MRSPTQGEWIVGALIVGFVVYLAMRGKLGTYWSLLMGGAIAKAPAATTAPAASSGMGSVLGAIPGLGGIGALGGIFDGLFGSSADATQAPGSSSSTSSTGGTIQDVLSGNAVTGTVTSNGNAQGSIWQYVQHPIAIPAVSF